MKKTDHAAKAGARALSPVATAGRRQVFPGRDVLEDVPECPWICSEFDDEDSDWPEMEETSTAYAGSGHREQADDLLAPDVETEINLLLRGVSYR